MEGPIAVYSPPSAPRVWLGQSGGAYLFHEDGGVATPPYCSRTPPTQHITARIAGAPGGGFILAETLVQNGTSAVPFTLNQAVLG